jgi:hypothetical protein
MKLIFVKVLSVSQNAHCDTEVENCILKNEFYKGRFGARVPSVENEPQGSFLWDECANALIKRVFYIIFSNLHPCFNF